MYKYLLLLVILVFWGLELNLHLAVPKPPSLLVGKTARASRQPSATPSFTWQRLLGTQLIVPLQEPLKGTLVKFLPIVTTFKLRWQTYYSPACALLATVVLALSERMRRHVRYCKVQRHHRYNQHLQHCRCRLPRRRRQHHPHHPLCDRHRHDSSAARTPSSAALL